MSEIKKAPCKEGNENQQYKDNNLQGFTTNFDFKKNISVEDIKTDGEQLLKQGNEASISDNLKTVLATREKLKETKANEIRFSESVLKQGENAVIFPHTINVIQGQAGVHKSRLAENICAAFLKLPNCNNELLGFNRLNSDVTHTVVYVVENPLKLTPSRHFKLTPVGHFKLTP